VKQSPRSPSPPPHSSPTSQPSRTAIGRLAEAVVLRRYEAAGYRELGRNVRVGALEIDLIVERTGLVVFCEVRSRADTRAGHPAETVSAIKRRRIRTAASRWLETSGHRPISVRFDVVTIVGHGPTAEVRIYANAF
jgi:putative endonuclease